MSPPPPPPPSPVNPLPLLALQLQAHLRRLGIPLKAALQGASSFDHADALTTVRKALAAGLFINAAKLTDEMTVKLSGVDGGNRVAAARVEHV